MFFSFTLMSESDHSSITPLSPPVVCGGMWHVHCSSRPAAAAAAVMFLALWLWLCVTGFGSPAQALCLQLTGCGYGCGSPALAPAPALASALARYLTRGCCLRAQVAVVGSNVNLTYDTEYLGDSGSILTGASDHCACKGTGWAGVGHWMRSGHWIARHGTDKPQHRSRLTTPPPSPSPPASLSHPNPTPNQSPPVHHSPREYCKFHP